MVPSPPHQPGMLPGWLAEQGATVVIAGGMGGRALELFRQRGVEVIMGVPAEEPEKLAIDYIKGNLQAGDNVCDH